MSLVRARKKKNPMFLDSSIFELNGLSGGFLTESFAARGFATRFVHRLTTGDYKVSEESGNIFVWNRSTGVVEEEKIPGFVRMSLRAIYQNSLNLDEQVLLLKTLKVCASNVFFCHLYQRQY